MENLIYLIHDNEADKVDIKDIEDPNDILLTKSGESIKLGTKHRAHSNEPMT